MKIRHLALLLLVFAFTVNCDTDRDDEPINRIVGIYTLVNYQCCLLTDEVYEESQITYDFDGDSSVTISFNIALDPDSQLPIKTAGIYEYTEVENLLILDGIQYEFTLIGEQLTLFDDPELDGSITTFKEFTPIEE